MAIEHKYLTARELKMSDEGSGSLSCYPSSFFDLDDGGDIAMPGCYTQTAEGFLKDGFAAQDHDWSYTGLKGYITEFREEPFGPYSTFAFHSTPDAQELRVKCRERMEAGKSVSISIGYEIVDCETIFPHQYETRLKEVLPFDKFQAAMAKLEKYSFPKIRLLKAVKLYEYSVVVVPMNKNATATGVKNNLAPLELKAQYLGECAEASATFAAISRLNDRLMYYCVYDALMDDDLAEAEKLAYIEGAMAEFSTLSVQIIKAMISLPSSEMETEAKSIRELWANPEITETPKTAPLLAHLKEIMAVVDAANHAVARTETKQTFRAGENRKLSATIVESLRSLKSRIDALLPTETESKDATDGESIDGPADFDWKMALEMARSQSLDVDAECALAFTG